MTNDLDTLATALYARIDDELKASPWLAPWRPAVGIAPTLSDAELVTLAVTSALLGYTSERRWLRRVGRDFGHLFPYVPQQSGYNKRLRAASSLLTSMIRILARDTSLWSDDVWLVDSTPVGCGCSRETATRSDLAGWAQYGYCASHSRYFWGLRLHLVCTPGGLPVLFALTGAKADERETLRDMLDTAPDVEAARPGQTIIGDKNTHLFKPLRQVIESINQTFKGQLDLERHGGKSPTGVAARILCRILALTAAIWHNDKTGQPIKRSLTAYDH
ncbi:transposase [Streptomyces prunicolor]|uniref:transposase n=1 Tax=Streptomyces prunicolor TaxID=67348 RepID=UPI003720BC90